MMQDLLSSCQSILLLGEANFSFSTSLRRMLPETVAMVTSCLQSLDRIAKDDPLIERNIQILKEADVQVLFEVDATKLDQCKSLDGILFDAVVFNFPHVGGKGNIGRNRDLLKQFFVCY
ncbi:ferredoxin-fold anticodon-binding domain-containing protein 1-like [Diadema antillarum]|uniref:ferredoxin-fold anticodon-binding domain-containing protein 1-like n=1 Tax=Diadema antillarum TaxID=105358 RepID=UPI003A88B64E